MIASPCPACGSTLVRRSHRIGLAEEMLSLVYVYPFRCRLCTHRFFSLQWGVRYYRRGLAPRGLTPSSWCLSPSEEGQAPACGRSQSLGCLSPWQGNH
jgi:hypothetical protein